MNWKKKKKKKKTKNDKATKENRSQQINWNSNDWKRWNDSSGKAELIFLN